MPRAAARQDARLPAPGRRERTSVRDVRPLRHVIPLATAALALLGASTASASPRQSFTGAFTTTQPGTSSGAEVSIVYLNPSDPNGKPPPVRHIVLRFAPGTRFDTSVPAACTASDAQLMAQGDAACPAASRVGSGQIDIATGLPAPGDLVQTDVSLFNAPGQLIFVVRRQGSSTTITTSRGSIAGDTLTTDVMATPGGPPDGQSSLKRVRLSLSALTARTGTTTKSYLTTPTSCPAGGRWTDLATFTYGDGATESVTSASPCAAATGVTAPGRTGAGSPSARRRHAQQRRRHHARRHHARRRAARPRFTG